jgi:Sec-independent protein translocase protein TatA
MTKLIIYGILLYLLYKFIFELVIPVSKATTQVKDKLKEMQEQQMRQQQNQQQQQAQAAQAQAQQAKQADVKSGDYIDFEEVK